MQCGECGSSLASGSLTCTECGAKQPAHLTVSSGSALISADRGSAGLPAMAGKNALPQPGSTYAGRYRVEKYLGLGSLCNAYLCRDIHVGNREVVLKVMHARKAAEAGMADSFLFLAESVARYNYKGIAKIFDFAWHEDACYYTMEWVSGVPLRLWLMERLNFENRVMPGLAIVKSLLETFEVIHERGCYGCLKPENVFITLNGPVVMDFGVVGFLTPQEFEFNSYARRYIPYMAPELRQDWSNLLPHSDFFSLGGLLYEILVGRAPATPLRLPSELSRFFGIDADEVILKSMAAKPMDRFGTLEGFRRALESLQANLLTAKAPGEVKEIPNDLSEPGTESHLELTSDVQSVHNPDISFSVPDPQETNMPEPGLPPASVPANHLGADLPTPRHGTPWIREPISNQEYRENSELGSKSVNIPAPSEANVEAMNPEFTGLAELADPNIEAAHSKRRFAYTPIKPLPVFSTDSLASGDGVDSSAMGIASPFAGLNGEIPDETGSQALPATSHIPAWLWMLILISGTALVALSAYFGMRFPR